MNHQFAALVGAAAVAIAAQATSPRSFGERDLQGIWTNATVTPLERPAEFAGKEFLTEAEAAAFEKRARDRNDADRREGDAEADLATGYNDLFWERGRSVVSTRRTSLVVDPPDGRIPPLTPEAQQKAAARAEARRLRPADGPEDRSLDDRCIVRGTSGPPMLPAGYSNNYQIVQSADSVAILVEMIHDARIIPIDAVNARPHLSGNIRQLTGRPARPLGRANAGRRHDEFYGQETIQGIRRAPARDRTLHARRCDHAPLPVHGGRPGNVYAALVRRDPDEEDRRSDLRIRLPRGELLDGVHPQRRQARREALTLTLGESSK